MIHRKSIYEKWHKLLSRWFWSLGATPQPPPETWLLLKYHLSTNVVEIPFNVESFCQDWLECQLLLKYLSVTFQRAEQSMVLIKNKIVEVQVKKVQIKKENVQSRCWERSPASHLPCRWVQLVTMPSTPRYTSPHIIHLIYAPPCENSCICLFA